MISLRWNCSRRWTTPRRGGPCSLERRLLAELEGGCLIPLAALGRDTEDGRLALDAAVFDPDGTEKVAAAALGTLDDPDGLGRAVAALLRERGAERVLRKVRSS